MLKASCYQNVEDHLKHRHELQGSQGEFIIDAEQTPKFASGGPVLPCLVCHGTFVSLTNAVNTEEGIKGAKVMTPAEHMVAQGEPVGLPQSTQSKFPSFIESAVQ